MFKKLLSNLSFNPSLIGQVAFYSQRLHREVFMRRMGVILVVFAVGIQLFAVFSPPESTLAESNNDIVRGGFTSKEQAVNYCRSNTQDFANTLAYYKISCDALQGASTKTVKSTDRNKEFDSLGRVPQGQTIARTGKPTNEYSVMINGTEYFMRNLWAWDTGASSSYKVLEMKNSDGTVIRILFNCGNIVTEGMYKPVVTEPKPAPVIKQVDICPNVPGTQATKEACDVCPNVPGDQTNKSAAFQMWVADPYGVRQQAFPCY